MSFSERASLPAAIGGEAATCLPEPRGDCHPTRALGPGSVIGIAAPASAFDREPFFWGIEWLKAQGFEPRFQEDIFARDYYLAGSISRRVKELQALLEDPDVDAILFARGGYGVMQMLSGVDFTPLLLDAKGVLGHSDLTPLLNLIVSRLGLVAYHGPLVAGLYKTEDTSRQQMLRLLSGDLAHPTYQSQAAHPLAPGKREGRLCGGNLTLVAACIGTPFDIETEGTILCLEEVGERPYRLDRLFWQLELAGKLDRVHGLALGTFVGCDEPGGSSRPLSEILEPILARHAFPVLSGLPFGHGTDNETLPLGARAELDASGGTLRVLQPCAEKVSGRQPSPC